MDDQTFKDLYGLTDKDKENLIKNISQDIEWTQDDLIADDDMSELDLEVDSD